MHTGLGGQTVDGQRLVAVHPPWYPIVPGLWVSQVADLKHGEVHLSIFDIDQCCR